VSVAGERFDPDLDLRVETEPPERLVVGRGDVRFLYGSCFHRRQRVRALRILVDGQPVEPVAEGMPRRDLFRALHPLLGLEQEAAMREDSGSEEDPRVLCYRSGFWALVPIEPPEGGAGRVEIVVEATLEDGTPALAPLAEPEVLAEPPADVPRAEARPDPELVAICMATHNPDPDLFAAQIESIRAQAHGSWICLVSDDNSHPETFAAIEAALGGDGRFLLSRSEQRLGFYRNFERALRMVPDAAAFVALADQDDRWDPDKLATLREELGRHQLVFSDARIVDAAGNRISDTYWTAREPNHTNLASLLIANSVTGAASLFRRELLDLALPFPSPPGTEYHDHWLALLALATGSIGFVERPLYDYVQHGGAVLGHAPTQEAGSRRMLRALREWRTHLLGWRTSYFYSYTRLAVLAQVVLLRGGKRIGPRKRRALRRFLSADGSPLGMAWLALRPLRRAGRRTETAGAERRLLEGVLWRRILTAFTGRHPSARREHDASLPALAPAPVSSSAGRRTVAAIKPLREALQPLELSVSEAEPERVNLLVPGIDLEHLFGGYITVFNLARKLAQHGARTRIVTVAPSSPLPRNWRDQIESYSGLRGLFSEVEVAFARDRDRPLPVNPRDGFVATAWWTAHAAHRAVRELRRERFLYLIQEYEPILFPMGTAAAMAMQTYEFPHYAMFSTELLRSFFAAQRIGVFSGAGGEADSISFQNAITPVQPPTERELEARSARRLLFYARPQEHAARNMFELGLMGLSDAVAAGAFGPEWQFHGIGTVEGGDRFELGSGRTLELLPRRDQGAYAELLSSGDVGLALMCTPHPSLVPLEMASAGMPTVTNSFSVKTPEAMRRLSANLIAREPTVEGVTAGLIEAVARCEDFGARIAAAEVDWSDDWERSLNAEVMAKAMDYLRRG
jgi:glycosyltransferase involved in cell wall biosynthesis